MSEIYGYARVSTDKQNIERQVANIKEKYPAADIYEESYTGTTMDRPQWKALSRKLKKGDTVVFDEVSRMSRDAKEGFKTYKRLYDKGVNLIFLKESALNTINFKETAQIALTGNDVDCILRGINEYLMILAEKQIASAFETAEHEVQFLRKRTSEGVRRAQRRYELEEIEGRPHEKKSVGRQEGSTIKTKKMLDLLPKIRKMSKDFDGCMTDKEIMETLGIARNTYYKYKNFLRF